MENKVIIDGIKLRDKKEVDNLIYHLNRVNGQINGIKQMIEESRCCDDVLIQIVAASQSLKSLGFTIMKNHLRTCVLSRLKKSDDELVDEIIKTVEKLNR